MTAIRTIEYTASPSGVKPIAPQDAGVRGEHKATNVVFNLDASLIKPEYKYRFEYVDGFSGFDTTEFVQPVGSTVSILLPVEWTAGGGCGTLRLCIVALDSQSNEEQTVYTFPASLLFAERETGGECNYKKGLSALISEAGKATDAANEAAESANAAADKVDEAVSSANAATANANRAAASADASAATAMSAAGTATTAAGAANTAASQAQAAKAAADTAASGADASAEQARTAAASANTAAGTANTAASNANAVAQTVQAKLDAGELKGEKGDKGDTGPKGPQGVSGVYVGSGDMPEGYTVQVDPTGDMLCYTAGESDSRYANVLTGTASGPVAALEDVSPTGALRRAAVLGATAETGSGDKSPDNPYTLAGVQPTKVTVCGKNLLDSKAANGSSNGVTWTVQSDGCIKVTGTATGTATIDILPPRNTPYFWMSQGYTPSGSVSLAIYAIKEDGTKEYGAITNLGIKVGLTPITGKIGILRVYKQYLSGDAADGTISPYIGLEPDHTYVPYAGQTIALPALAPLYGDGTVNDEYDAVSGVETRRWKQVVFDGTEKWNKWREDVCIYSLTRPALVAHQGTCNAYPIFKSVNWNAFPDRQFSIETKQINFRNNACADVDSWKSYLAAQYAAGTPVTVVYQLDAPVVTRHDPARILPPAPVCRVFADAGNTAVGYNRDVNIVIPKLEAALAELLGGEAQPMT